MDRADTVGERAIAEHDGVFVRALDIPVVEDKFRERAALEHLRLLVAVLDGFEQRVLHVASGHIALLTLLGRQFDDGSLFVDGAVGHYPVSMARRQKRSAAEPRVESGERKP